MKKHSSLRRKEKTVYETFGYALAMRVLQSKLYPKLDDLERAECDELIRRGQKDQEHQVLKENRRLSEAP